MTSTKSKRRAIRAAKLQNFLQSELVTDAEDHPISSSPAQSIVSSTPSSSWSIKSLLTRAGQAIGLLQDSSKSLPEPGLKLRRSQDSDLLHNIIEHHDGQPIVKRRLSDLERKGRSFFRFGRRRNHKKVQLSDQDENKLYDGQQFQHSDDPSLNHLLDEYDVNSRESEKILQELNEFYIKSGVQDHEELLNMLIRYAQNAKSSGGAGSSGPDGAEEPRNHQGVDEEGEKKILKEMYGRFLASGVEAENVLDVLKKEAEKLRQRRKTTMQKSKL